jgi:hypothetical protein
MSGVEWLRWISWFVVEPLKYFLLTYGVFGVPLRKRKCWYISVLASIVCVLMCKFTGVKVLFYRTFLGSIIIWTIFTVNVFEMLQLFVVEFYLIDISDMFVWAVYQGIMSAEYVFYETYITWLSNLFTIVLFVIISFICRNHREAIYKKIKEERTEKKVLFIVFLMIVTTAISSVQGFLFGKLSGNLPQIAVFAIVVSVLFFIVLFVLLLSALQSRQRLMRINELTGEQMDLQKRYFEEARNADEQVKMIRHDLKNHLLLMRIMLEDEETDRLKEYLEKLTEMYQAIEMVSTGNTVADCLLNNMINRLQNDGKFDYLIEGKFTPDFQMDDLDCCILLSNALDNAREALEKLPEEERYFRMEIRHYGETLCLRISNRTTAIADEQLYMTKKEGIHGYGIKNMKRVAEKYNGSISWTCREGEMTVDIILDEKSDKKSTKV